MSEIIIVAGPNGAGKTTFANAFLPMERGRFVYINADEIARELDLVAPHTAYREFHAGREMLLRIDDAINQDRDLMFETTLASLSYAQKIPRWQKLGYKITLHYLSLSSVEIALGRVRKRVAQGGHDIPQFIVRQRFTKSQDYLERIYKPIVDSWYVWDSLEGDFMKHEASQDR